MKKPPQLTAEDWRESAENAAYWESEIGKELVRERELEPNLYDRTARWALAARELLREIENTSHLEMDCVLCKQLQEKARALAADAEEEKP